MKLAEEVAQDVAAEMMVSVQYNHAPLVQAIEQARREGAEEMRSQIIEFLETEELTWEQLGVEAIRNLPLVPEGEA